MRLLGVAGAGSWISGQMDAFSDLDLVVVVADAHAEAVARERMQLVEGLGKCLVAFTGEHVGEPRLIIALYDEPLLHVDLKFVALADFGSRVEDPLVVWEREGALSAVISASASAYPKPNAQWIEDRFWVWVHYATLRLGRGEHFEVVGFLAFLRDRVLGPYALLQHGERANGVRRVEQLAPRHLADLTATAVAPEAAACAQGIRAAISLYRRLRDELASPGLVRRTAAEQRAIAYFEEVAATKA